MSQSGPEFMTWMPLESTAAEERIANGAPRWVSVCPRGRYLAMGDLDRAFLLDTLSPGAGWKEVSCPVPFMRKSAAVTSGGGLWIATGRHLLLCHAGKITQGYAIASRDRIWGDEDWVATLEIVLSREKTSCLHYNARGVSGWRSLHMEGVVIDLWQDSADALLLLACDSRYRLRLYRWSPETGELVLRDETEHPLPPEGEGHGLNPMSVYHVTRNTHGWPLPGGGRRILLLPETLTVGPDLTLRTDPGGPGWQVLDRSGDTGPREGLVAWTALAVLGGRLEGVPLVGISPESVLATIIEPHAIHVVTTCGCARFGTPDAAPAAMLERLETEWDEWMARFLLRQTAGALPRQLALVVALKGVLVKDEGLAWDNRHRLRDLFLWYFRVYVRNFEMSLGEGDDAAVFGLLESMFEDAFECPVMMPAMARVLAAGVREGAEWATHLALFIPTLEPGKRAALPAWLCRMLPRMGDLLLGLERPGLADWVLWQGEELDLDDAAAAMLARRFPGSGRVLRAAGYLAGQRPEMSGGALTRYLLERFLTVLDRIPTLALELVELGILAGRTPPGLVDERTPEEQRELLLLAGQEIDDIGRMEILLSWMLGKGKIPRLRLVRKALGRLSQDCFIDLRVVALVELWAWLEGGAQPEEGPCGESLVASLAGDTRHPRQLIARLWRADIGGDGEWRWYWAAGLLACTLQALPSAFSRDPEEVMTSVAGTGKMPASALVDWYLVGREPEIRQMLEIVREEMPARPSAVSLGRLLLWRLRPGPARGRPGAPAVGEGDDNRKEH